VDELKNEISKMVQTIEETTTMFYQQKNDSGYKQLDHTLAVLMQGIDHLLKLKKDGFDINIDEKEINQVLSNAIEALTKKDTILLSDVLQYDLIGLLKQSM
jgi:hypothetical protein